jgi:hypothetical protein
MILMNVNGKARHHHQLVKHPHQLHMTLLCCSSILRRGEGWGRPQMEAMSMAKPVITTNWSGPTAYINEAVAYPLAIDHLAAADADMNFTVTDMKEINPYFKGQFWAQPNVAHLRQLLREVCTSASLLLQHVVCGDDSLCRVSYSGPAQRTSELTAGTLWSCCCNCRYLGVLSQTSATPAGTVHAC